MYDESTIGLEEAMNGLKAMLEQTNKEATRPVSIAIVDKNGNLILFAKMDQCRSLPQRLAYKKAYTAMTMQSDTADVEERFRNTGRNISDFGDPNMIALKGGIVVRKSDDKAIGAIGVSGLTADEDENIANIGLRAMNL